MKQLADLNRARAYMERGRYELARDEALRAVSANPDSAEAWAVLGVCQSLAGDRKSGLANAQKAVGLSPGWYYTHYVLAEVLCDMERFKEAKVEAELALSFDSSRVACITVHARALFGLCKWNECLASCAMGLAINPTHEKCLRMSNISLTMLGRFDEALEVHKTSLAAHPSNALSHFGMAHTLSQMKRFSEAIPYYQEAARLDPSSELARDGLVEANRNKHGFYQKLIRYSPWNAKPLTPLRFLLVFSALILQGLVYASRVPALRFVAIPVAVIYVAYMFVTFTGRQWLDIVLSFSETERQALPLSARRLNVFFAAGTMIAICSVFVAVVVEKPMLWLAALAAFGFAGLMGNVSSEYPERKRLRAANWLMSGLVVSVAVFTWLGLATSILGSFPKR